MPRPMLLTWKAPATAPSRFWRWGIVLATVGFAASVTAWALALQRLDSLSQESQPTVRASRAVPPPLSEKERGRLREEIAAVNQPIRQLNQRWDVLLADLRPGRSAVRLIDVDIDARTLRLRVTGVAPKLGQMADFVADLATRQSLRDVALARHDADRDGHGYRFVVEARWANGR